MPPKHKSTKQPPPNATEQPLSDATEQPLLDVTKRTRSTGRTRAATNAAVVQGGSHYTTVLSIFSHESRVSEAKGEGLTTRRPTNKMAECKVLKIKQGTSSC